MPVLLRLMKVHTTNAHDLFVTVADDCPVREAQVPPQSPDKPDSAARLQYDWLIDAPYRYSSDDVLFGIFALRQGIPMLEKPSARELFFSKGQACFRASPLAKRYGWGFHHNADGKVALVPLGSEAYDRLSSNEHLTVVKAMRNKKA